MQQQISSKWIWLIFTGAIVLLFSSLGKMPLWIYDEVRNAECAREMWERKDWIVPTFNGELRTLNPPLHYFFMFLGFEIFGINAEGARFFHFDPHLGVIISLLFYLSNLLSSVGGAYFVFHDPLKETNSCVLDIYHAADD